VNPMIRKATLKSSETPAGEYVEKDYQALRGLRMIPDALIEAHLKLYSGYVKNMNKLREAISGADIGSTEWAELQRHVGFELNGIRLHELYFNNLTPGGTTPPRSLATTLGDSWASFDAWSREFRGIGMMRGVGWAILYRDPLTQRLSNHWIGLHHDGHPAGFTPILVMDVWEHAFTGMEREKYIDAFFANANWEEVEARLKAEA